MNAQRWRQIALASLVGLMIVSLSLAAFAGGRPGHTSGGPPPGLVLAIAKLLVLALLFNRVWHANVYSLQWSSMLILLLLAEGTVRAASDPSATAALGLVEAVLAFVYFVAVLAILRPLKKRARAAARDGPTNR